MIKRRNTAPGFKALDPKKCFGTQLLMYSRKGFKFIKTQENIDVSLMTFERFLFVLIFPEFFLTFSDFLRGKLTIFCIFF